MSHSIAGTFPAPSAATHALNCACVEGTVDVILSVADQYPQIFSQSSALRIAAEHNQLEAIVHLVHSFPNIDPTAEDSFGRNALLGAAAAGSDHRSFRALAACFGQWYYEIASCNDTRTTPLLLLITNRHFHSIEGLHAAFPNLNPCERDIYGNCPLVLASTNENAEAITILSRVFGDSIGPDYHSAMLAAAYANQAIAIRALHLAFPHRSDHLYELFYAAIQTKHVDALTALLEAFPHMSCNNIEVSTGHTLLMKAALCNAPRAIHLLAKKYPTIDPHMRALDGSTAFDIAIRCAHASCAYVLHLSFPSLEVPQSISWFLRPQQSPSAKAFFQAHHHEYPINQVDRGGRTLLMTAVRTDSRSFITAMSKRFPTTDPNIQDNRGDTALIDLMRTTHIRCVRTLRQTFPNINPEIQNKCGQNALLCATKMESDTSLLMIRALAHEFPNINPNVQDFLYPITLAELLADRNAAAAAAAAANDHTSKPTTTTNSTITITTIPTSTKVYHNTPLMLAVLSNSLDRVGTLYECFAHRIDINIQQESTGETALMLAVRQNNPDMVQLLCYLFHNRLHIDQRNHQGQNVFMIAVQNAPKCIPVLMHFFPNIDLNSKDKFGTTALMYAAAAESVDGLIALSPYRTSIDPDLVNNAGRTALSLCIHEENIFQLYTHFPQLDPNICDIDGRTALSHYALSAAPASFLIDTIFRCFPTTDSYIRCKEQFSPLQYSLFNHPAIISQLLSHIYYQRDTK